MFLIVGGDSEIGATTYREMTIIGRSVAATTRNPQRIAPDWPFLDLSTTLEFWIPPQGTTAACMCAAVSRLAACAADPEGTAHINVTQTLSLLDNLLARGIYVLFLSTNQVFNGQVPHARANTPHTPVSEYGRQKARVEAELLSRMDRGAPVAILRLAKVVSPNMALIHNWIGALTTGKSIQGFYDMTLAPTPTDMVCATIGSLLEDRVSGIFQLTGPRDVAYVDVARFVASCLGVDPTLVEEGSARAAGLPEGATTLNTTLDSSLLRERYGYNVPDVWKVIERVISTAAR